MSPLQDLYKLFVYHVPSVVRINRIILLFLTTTNIFGYYYFSDVIMKHFLRIDFYFTHSYIFQNFDSSEASLSDPLV